MTSAATPDSFNQSPPFEDIDLFAIDRSLVEAVAFNEGSSAFVAHSNFGRLWGSAEMAQRGRLANENPPVLTTVDASGNRIDRVEFHPAYHELMTHSIDAGIHNSSWSADGRPAGLNSNAPAPPPVRAPRTQSASASTGIRHPVAGIGNHGHTQGRKLS